MPDESKLSLPVTFNYSMADWDSDIIDQKQPVKVVIDPKGITIIILDDRGNEISCVLLEFHNGKSVVRCWTEGSDADGNEYDDKEPETIFLTK